jgi:two-component system, cell cycle response regulator
MQRMADAPEETTSTSPNPDGPAPVPVPRGATAYLVVISGPSFGEMYKLKGDRSVLGRGDRTDIRIIDDGVSREHAAIERDRGRLVLRDLRSTNGTFWNGQRIDRQELVDGDKIAIGSSTILKFTFQDHIDEHFQKQLFESALRDGLTGTFNRRYFLDRLNGEMRFAVRHSKPLTLLFVDIDHFKRINDSFGHQAGDEILMGVARVMMAALRAEDVLARYGGEEFAVICREIEVEGAQTLANRLCTAIAAKEFKYKAHVIPVTVSIGAAVDVSLQEPQTLIAAADAAMYEAKRTGRNRVCMHVPSGAGPEAAKKESAPGGGGGGG